MKLKYRNKIKILNQNLIYGSFYPPYSWVSLTIFWRKCKGIFPGLVNASIFRIKLKIYEHSTSKSLNVRRRNLWAFDVEISERSTLKSQSVRRRTLFESFAFEPSTAIAFKSLKCQSCLTFERFKIADEGEITRVRNLQFRKLRAFKPSNARSVQNFVSS